MEQMGQEVVRMLTLGMKASGLTGGMPDPHTTVQVTGWLQERARDPTFNLCLAAVASAQGQLDDAIRQQATLLLKNNIVRHFDVAVRPNLAQVQQRLLAGLSDPTDGVRKAMASAVSEVAKAGGSAALGPLVAQLWAQLQQAPKLSPQRLGCLVCLRNVCEDCWENLGEAPAAGQQTIVAVLLPEMVQMLNSTADSVQQPGGGVAAARELQLVLEALYFLVDSDNAAPGTAAHTQAQQQIPGLLEGLRKSMTAAGAVTAGGAAADGKKLYAGSLRCYKFLVPHYALLKQGGVLAEVLPLIYKCTAEADPDLSLAACEFWNELAQNPAAVHDVVAQGLLAKLLEQLLDKIRYSDIELAMLQEEETRGDVKPQLRRKGKGDDDGDDEEEVDQWTVRKCAATTLDALSNILGDELVTPPGTQPGWLLSAQIEVRLGSPDHLAQEAALLALGAIAHGCTGAIRPHLPGLMGLLFQLIANEQQHFHVRAMALWTMSRYCSWMVNQALDADGGSAQWVDQYLHVVLAAMADRTRTVQHRAVSAFACMLDAADELICAARYLDKITASVAPCLLPQNHASPANPQGYTTRNLCILLDSIGMLMRTAGEHLATPAAQQQIFNPLFLQLLPGTPDDNAHLLPRVLQCAHAALRGLGQHAQPYAAALFQRALTMVARFTAQQRLFAKPGGAPDPPDIDNAWWGYEILIAIVDTLHDDYPGEIEGLALQARLDGEQECACNYAVAPISEQLGCDEQILHKAMEFLATCVERFPAQLIAPVAGMVPLLVKQCAAEGELCSNTCWFLGVICVAADALPAEQSRQAVGQAAMALVPILQAGRWFPQILQNAAVAVGRCGVVQPQLLGEQLHAFVEPLVTHLAKMPEGVDDKGKKDAFIGLLRMLNVNFAVLQQPNVLRPLFVAMAAYRERGGDVTQGFCELLQTLRQRAGGQWSAIQQLFPPNFPHDLLAAAA